MALGEMRQVYSNLGLLSVAWLYLILLKNNLYHFRVDPLSVLKDLFVPQKNVDFFVTPEDGTKRMFFFAIGRTL